MSADQVNRKKELTAKLQTLASEYKTNKILLEKNLKDDSKEANSRQSLPSRQAPVASQQTS